MSITRTKLAFERNFVQIPNAWMRDPRLSRRARGLLAEMMTHEIGWKMTVNSLAAVGPEGRDAVRGAVKELEALGYLLREVRKESGRFDGVDYILNDPHPPMTENPALENDDILPPMTENPSPGNPAPGNHPLRTPLLKTPISEEGGLAIVGKSPGADSEEKSTPYEDLHGRSLERPVASLRRDRCEFHQGVDYPPPCLGCKKARLAMIDADREAFHAQLGRDKEIQLEAHKLRIERIKECEICDEDGYTSGRVCYHDPDMADRARRGAALARQALHGASGE